MGCASSVSVKSNTSRTSLREVDTPPTTNVRRGNTRVGPNDGGPTVNGSECSITSSDRNPGIAFEVNLGEEQSILKPPPKRLSRLDPIDAPRLTAEELEEKLRLAERKRNSELESRAKTASESRRQSKRKRELTIARELERQHQQAKELETKLKSAEKQREIQLQHKTERQKIQEERIKRARSKKEKLLLDDDVISDVERDDNFNNDDVDSWFEGSNNETNTVDTGFSSATSERIYSGRESPKKKFHSNMISRSSHLNSASTVDSCDLTTYKQSRENLRQTSVIGSQTKEGDEFFDS